MSNSGKNFKRTKNACYFSFIAGSSAFSLPPILFLTFRHLYGISYTLLGTLVLVNFCTQFIVDLILTFYSNRFNIRKTVCSMPLLTTTGLSIYALVPTFFPQNAYFGLLVGTIVFSIGSGLGEVLLSPLIAAIPSETPDRDMSLVHSLYAYGVVTVVIISTIFLKIFGEQYWMILTLFWATLPIISCILYCISPFPEMTLSNSGEKGKNRRGKGLILCAMCIFLGGAAENSMTNWISCYIENALQISKVTGDIVGMASFAILLGVGRTMYAKYGKNIIAVLLFGMVGATACYLIAGLCPNPVISMFACIFTGLCTSMLWPGTLIMMEENIPDAGVAAYALMAAGGDFGSSIAPQALGVVVDTVSASGWAASLSSMLEISAEQIGMKAGMLSASIFPILGVILILYIKKYFSTKSE